MAVLLFSLIGLAVDAGFAYLNSTAEEHAAAAAALAGVPYMPYFDASNRDPISGRDATQMALDAAAANGFSASHVGCKGKRDSVTITSPASQELTATITRYVPTFFLTFSGFGCNAVTFSRTAAYLQPINLGQGVTTLGAGGTCYLDPLSTDSAACGGQFQGFVLRQHSWTSVRSQGDPFTSCADDHQDVDTVPNYNSVYTAANGAGYVCPVAGNATDNNVHEFNGFGNNPTDPSTINYISGAPATGKLPAKGGENYLLYVAPNKSVQLEVFNAGWSSRQVAPDTSPAGQPNCDLLGTSPCQACDPHVAAAPGPVSTAETDHPSCPISDSLTGDPNVYPARTALHTIYQDFGTTEYTVFKVRDLYDRASDQALDRILIRGVDAQLNNTTPCLAGDACFVDPGNDGITQHAISATTAGAACSALNSSLAGGMHIFQDWINIADASAATAIGPCADGDPTGADSSLVQVQGPGSGSANATLDGGSGAGGTYYRLRVDAMGNHPSPNDPFSNPNYQTNPSYAWHSYSLRALDNSTGAACSQGASPVCTLTAWDEMVFNTQVQGDCTGGTSPIPDPDCNSNSGTPPPTCSTNVSPAATCPPSSFAFNLFAIPKGYGGQTIDVSLWDPGDLNSCTDPNCTINTPRRNIMSLIDPTTVSAGNPSGSPFINGHGNSQVQIFDIGTNFANLEPYIADGNHAIPTWSQDMDTTSAGCTTTACPQASADVIDSSWSDPGGCVNVTLGPHPACWNKNVYNGHWLVFQITLPTNYDSRANAQSAWQLRYTIREATAGDILAVRVNAQGVPDHIIG